MYSWVTMQSEYKFCASGLHLQSTVLCFTCIIIHPHVPPGCLQVGGILQEPWSALCIWYHLLPWLQPHWEVCTCTCRSYYGSPWLGIFNPYLGRLRPHSQNSPDLQMETCRSKYKCPCAHKQPHIKCQCYEPTWTSPVGQWVTAPLIGDGSVLQGTRIGALVILFCSRISPQVLMSLSGGTRTHHPPAASQCWHQHALVSCPHNSTCKAQILRLAKLCASPFCLDTRLGVLCRENPR